MSLLVKALLVGTMLLLPVACSTDDGTSDTVIVTKKPSTSTSTASGSTSTSGSTTVTGGIK